jgi:hypothetical protein
MAPAVHELLHPPIELSEVNVTRIVGDNGFPNSSASLGQSSHDPRQWRISADALKAFVERDQEAEGGLMREPPQSMRLPLGSTAIFPILSTCYSQLKYDRVVLSLITIPLASISGLA